MRHHLLREVVHTYFICSLLPRSGKKRISWRVHFTAGLMRRSNFDTFRGCFLIVGAIQFRFGLIEPE